MDLRYRRRELGHFFSARSPIVSVSLICLIGTIMSSREPFVNTLVELGKGLTNDSLILDRLVSVSDDCFIIV